MRRHPLPLGRGLEGPPFALPAILDRCSERWWRTSPRRRALVVALLAAASLAAGTVRLAASPWGTPVSVLVADRDLAVGEQVGPADLTRADRPSDLVPDRALTRPSGTVVAPVPAGSVVTDQHVRDGGIGAALPDDQAAVPLPVEVVPELPVGARIDLVAADLDQRGVLLASGAVVLAEDGLHVWVAVDRPVAADVAAAALSGAITAVVVPP